MRSGSEPGSAGAPMRAEAVAALRRLAVDYVGARRVFGELRSRLAGVVLDRSRVTEDGGGLVADERLAEIDRSRAALDRSAGAAVARVRALEAVITAVALGALADTARARSRGADRDMTPDARPLLPPELGAPGVLEATSYVCGHPTAPTT